MANDTIKIKPIGGYILIEAAEEGEKKTASGLIIQDSSKGERPQKGKVIALGSGQKDEKGNNLPWNVEVGQTVMFKKYSPEDVETDGKKYLLMKEADILAVVQD